MLEALQVRGHEQRVCGVHLGCFKPVRLNILLAEISVTEFISASSETLGQSV